MSADEVLAEHGYQLDAEHARSTSPAGSTGRGADEHSQSRDHYVAWQRQRTLAMLEASDVHPGEHDVILEKLRAGTAIEELEAYDEVPDVLRASCRATGASACSSARTGERDLAAVAESGLTDLVDVVSSAWVGAGSRTPASTPTPLRAARYRLRMALFHGRYLEPRRRGPHCFRDATTCAATATGRTRPARTTIRRVGGSRGDLPTSRSSRPDLTKGFTLCAMSQPGGPLSAPKPPPMSSSDPRRLRLRPHPAGCDRQGQDSGAGQAHAGRRRPTCSTPCATTSASRPSGRVRHRRCSRSSARRSTTRWRTSTNGCARSRSTPVNDNRQARIHRDPLGAVLIIGPWNYPIQLVLAPLVAALAAGNTAAVKPSEISAGSCTVLARLLPEYLDAECVAVVEGGASETTALLEERWDHIFSHGNGTIGRVVMAAAAKHLTPVTLELGGKSPVIVDQSADLDVAARRIAWGKFTERGCDPVWPPTTCSSTAASKVRSPPAATVRSFYGTDPRQHDYGRIVDRRRSPRHAPARRRRCRR